MSRRFLHIALCFLMIGSGLALSSCLKEEMAVDDVSRPSDYVSFSSALSPLSGNAATRSSANYLEISEEDWPLEGEVSSTKATPMAALADNLAVGIVGFNYTGAWIDSNTPWSDGGAASMDNISYTYSSGTGVLSAASPIPWKNLTYTTSSDKLRIYAYAPMGDFSSYIVKDGSGNIVGVPQISYTVPDAVGDQKDLIVANNEVAANAKTTIPLNFTHALTAIQFKVGFACYVTSLQIKGVYGTGTYTIGSGWSANTPKDFTAISYETESFAADAMIADGAKTFLMIPQTVPADATVVLKFKTSPESDEKTLTARIDGQVWPAGKRITYTIMETPSGIIYFDLDAGDVNIHYNTTYSKYWYSGYVYINSGAGTALVEGEHLESNKYYVYQSTSSNKSLHGWSGAKDASTWRNPPTYGEVKYPTASSQTWSEYITNNPDCDAVITNWPTAAAAVGRTATAHKIWINGDKTTGSEAGKVLAVDMTIDNVWSSIDNSSTAENFTCGFTIHPANQMPNLNPASTPNYKTVSSAYRYEHVTLKLKGDNRFYNMMYFGHAVSQTNENAAWFKVTSHDGDGSSKGSLTVNPSSTSSVITEGNSVLGCKNDNYGPPGLGFKFYGGTIYVSTNKKSTEYNIGVLGGGSNNGCEITFDGAVVTAVAYSSAAAIGGGSGRLLWGGDGEITIRSGKIYAYQFGCYANPITTNSYYDGYRTLPEGAALASVAIGGGSSFCDTGNNAIINISGGEVFAQSLGGAAIGGGSSQFANGGRADITISGGHVEARSVSGIGHRDKSFTAGGSMGGGRGGIGYAMDHPQGSLTDENYYVGFGGFADITISGGVVKTGSLGGGSTITRRTDISIGSADIKVTGGVIQGQFIMAKGTAAIAPSFSMTNGTVRNDLANDITFIQPHGGAVYIDEGSCTISGGIIRNCSTTGKGGAVYLNRGTVSLSGNAIIENCSAESGGGAVFIDDGTFTMSGSSSISSCMSSTHGGGIYVDGGTVEVSAGSITGNIASGSTANGGGVYINRGSFSMPDGSTATISNNHARGNGGGVYVTSATDVEASVISGSITGNAADGNGGGVCVIPSGENTATVTIGKAGQGDDNPEITGNNAGLAGGGLYAQGTNAIITINSGQIKSNNVTGYVYNPDVANERGMVYLYGGDVTHVTITFDPNGGTYTPGGTCQQKIVKATNSLLFLPSSGDFSHEMYGTLSGWKDINGTSYINNQVMNITEDLT